jgi:hypothetical protein
MTPEEHNKFVGIANLAFGAIHILMMLVTGALFGVMMGMLKANARSSGGLSPAFISMIMVFAVVLNVVLAIPSFVAGYAFLKKKPWAKVAGIIAAVLSALRIPFGTLVSIYTFWFLFSATGKSLYDGQSLALPPAPPADWVGVEGQKGREHQYVPPISPPNWR